MLKKQSKKNQAVLCIGSMGKDIFFPLEATEKDSKKTAEERVWTFNFGAKIHVEDRYLAPGGCACNVSVGLSRLGISGAAYGITGDDEVGKWIKNTLHVEGVETSDVVKIEKKNSDISMILIDKNSGERTIFVNRDVGENLQLKLKEIALPGWIFVGSLYGEEILDNMKQIHYFVASSKTRLIYNPSMHNIKTQPRMVWDLIHHASLLFLNRTEAREIITQIVLSNDSKYNKEDLKDDKKILKILAKQSGKDASVIMTCGPEGALAIKEDKCYHVDTRQQSVVDATGAGDAFASGFIAAHHKKSEIEESLRWGAANSHSVIGYYGAHKGLLKSTLIKQEAEYFKTTLLK